MSLQCKSLRIQFLTPYAKVYAQVHAQQELSFVMRGHQRKELLFVLLFHCTSLHFCCHGKIPGPKTASRRKGHCSRGTEWEEQVKVQAKLGGGSRRLADLIYLHPHAGIRERKTVSGEAVSDFLQQGSASYRFHHIPNSTSDWEPNVSRYEPLGTPLV